MSKEEEMSLEWIKMRADINKMEPETFGAKFSRKVKENPFVPFGCLATLGALTYGLYSFRSGDKKMSQMMMRTRIAAQGFTIVALLVGIGLQMNKK